MTSERRGGGTTVQLYRSDRGVFQTLRQVFEYSPEKRYREQRNGRRALPLPAAAFQFLGVWPVHKGQNQDRDELDKSGVRAKDLVPEAHLETPEPCWAGLPLAWAQELSQAFRCSKGSRGSTSPSQEPRAGFASILTGKAQQDTKSQGIGEPQRDVREPSGLS